MYDEIETKRKLRQTQAVLSRAEREVRTLRYLILLRERELRDIKGPCKINSCRLHRSHEGPCDIRPEIALPTDPRHG